MLTAILLVLILLWLFGFLQVPLFGLTLFSLGRSIITINDLLIFLVMVWLIDLLPYPFRQIAMVLLLLWVLAAFGVIAIAGFSSLVLIAIIFGLIAYLGQERWR